MKIRQVVFGLSLIGLSLNALAATPPTVTVSYAINENGGAVITTVTTNSDGSTTTITTPPSGIGRAALTQMLTQNQNKVNGVNVMVTTAQKNITTIQAALADPTLIQP